LSRGQDLSYDFMRLPSKRQYADYYVFIKHPVCLEDIKDKLDSFQYSNLQSVKQDLDLCFKNARKLVFRGCNLEGSS
jgi:chromatin structure-remodeling complex subunit RSC4